MKWLLKAIGTVMESIKGPGTTIIQQGESLHRTATVTYDSASLVFEITSHRVIYLSTYSRPWIPQDRRAVFEVEGKVIHGDASQVNPKLLEKVVFPNLSSRLLLHTEYPHIRAIGAYIDRVSKRIGSTILLV